MPRRRMAELLERPQLARVLARVNRTAVAGGVRSFFTDVRTQIRDRARPLAIAPASELAARVAGRLLGETGSPLRPVVNATGILLPGGSGRAPLADKAIERVAAVARDYADINFAASPIGLTDCRQAVTQLVCQFTGAPAAMIVNTTSAAVLLAVAALAPGREIVVSRGELLELDGTRATDIIRTAGGLLRDVGTTNKTCVNDYRDVITADTAAILRLHPYDFRVVGSADRPSVSELAELGHRHAIPLIDCLGPAAGINLAEYGLPNEPNVPASLLQGADLVLFSGDGRLAGPACGIIAGDETLVERLERHPLANALLADKLTLAALAATIEVLRDEAAAVREIPLLQSLSAPLENLRQRAERIASQVGWGVIRSAEACERDAYLTDARLPDERIASWSVALIPRGTTPAQLATRLAQGSPSVAGSTDGDRLFLNLRSVFPRQDPDIVDAIARNS